MSHAATIIGIPGLQIERVKRSRGIEVWAMCRWTQPATQPTAMLPPRAL